MAWNRRNGEGTAWNRMNSEGMGRNRRNIEVMMWTGKVAKPSGV